MFTWTLPEINCRDGCAKGSSVNIKQRTKFHVQIYFSSFGKLKNVLIERVKLERRSISNGGKILKDSEILYFDL